MKYVLTPLFLVFAVSTAYAQVQYVKVCSLYGEGFFYVPGTDVCHNPLTGDTRQQTEGGTWRSMLPYPEGAWVTNALSECAPGKLVKLGDFKSTDFTLNEWERKQTAPIALTLESGEFISKVIMQGGFVNPLVQAERQGVNSSVGLCVRSKDPDVFLESGENFFNPPFGTGYIPLGCVANTRIVNMPAAYAVSATAAYPSVTYGSLGAFQPTGPYVYGSQLVVTTDVGRGGPFLLTYTDPEFNQKPMEGTLSVSVCVANGK